MAGLPFAAAAGAPAAIPGGGVASAGSAGPAGTVSGGPARSAGLGATGRMSASERAYAYVKDEILKRRFAAHDLLSEGQIAEALGISRTPVREALLRLQAEGLLRLLPKRGALVMPVTATEAADVMETRQVIESYAILKIVRRRADRGAGGEDADEVSASLLPALDGHIADMREAMAAGDATGYVAADRAFHIAIVAATGNEILTSLYRSLRERQLRMGLVNLLDDAGAKVDPARMRSTLTEHERIRYAIAAGDADVAADAIEAHLERTARNLFRDL